MSSSSTSTKPLVSTEWVAEHGKDKGIRVVEVDVDPSNYDKGHIDGAVGWNWRKDLQHQLVRDVASKEELASLLGKSGVTQGGRSTTQRGVKSLAREPARNRTAFCRLLRHGCASASPFTF